MFLRLRSCTENRRQNVTSVRHAIAYRFFHAVGFPNAEKPRAYPSQRTGVGEVMAPRGDIAGNRGGRGENRISGKDSHVLIFYIFQYRNVVRGRIACQTVKNKKKNNTKNLGFPNENKPYKALRL